MKRTEIVSPLLLVALSACSSPERHSGNELPPSSRPDFEAAREIGAGFDRLESGEEWRVGDRVVYGVELRGGEATRRWIIELLVASPPGIDRDGSTRSDYSVEMTVQGTVDLRLVSRRMDIQVNVFDESGEWRSTAQLSVPEAFLRAGFYRYCEWGLANPERIESARTGEALTPDEYRLLIEPIFSLTEFFGLVMGNSALSPVFEEVVERPDFLSFDLAKDLNVGVLAPPQDAYVVENPLPELSGVEPPFCLPVEFALHDLPALECRLLVTAPAPPLQLAAGILGIEGVHPNDAERRFRAWLLAARRGTENETKQRALLEAWRKHVGRKRGNGR